ncbi:YfcC family protein [Clostridium tetani]|uniref:YfcC family protein n=1 Tax=Clostridium tetani TaxID=1513 RepID=A0ABY0ERI2_CLOTA|nr:Na+/H+ antiporter NhaC family protein [Clostridium tetani]CDI50669.1 transporter [Clostridium tetani 12124569]KHO32191.1 repressor [Clostridium tetani]RXI39711.1 YfcC family protein [Clostridium tetani]RXI57813.1 YfcC family protein [Clostridium tetani]RXI67741.1 YfcC family protein [Clostridium tetani]
MTTQVENVKKKKSFKMPHSYVIIFMILILASLMTYVIPAGEYGRYKNELGKMVVDGSVFNFIKQSPVPMWDIPLHIVKSLNKQSEIIFALLVIGGSLEVIISTGMFHAFCNKLSKASAGKEKLFIPAFVLLFAVIGITQSTNKFIGFAPLGVMLAVTLGYDAIVGVAIVLLGIGVGFSTGILAPTTAVAQEIAGLPAYSGMGLRVISFVVFYIITTIYILRYGEKVRKDPTKSVVYGSEGLKEFNLKDVEIEIKKKHYAVLVVVLASFSVLMYGCIKFGWGLTENAVLFMWMAILGGFAYGYCASDIAKNFVKGSKAMVSAALVVGLGATVATILNEGKILDTVVKDLSILFDIFPNILKAPIMFIMNIIINFFVTSGNGQAAIVMPVMIPLADLAGISRQSTVLAFKLGDGFSNYILPHASALMGFLGATGITYDKWMKFMGKLFGWWILAGSIILIIGTLINY